jgi:hypothetical protein
MRQAGSSDAATALAFIAIGLLGCGHGSPERLGAVSEDGIQAFEDWCSHRLERPSKTAFTKGLMILRSDTAQSVDQFPHASDNLVILDCPSADKLEETDAYGGRGWLAYEPDTYQLVTLSVEVSPYRFHDVVDRVLLPALSAEQRERLNELEVITPRTYNRPKAGDPDPYPFYSDCPASEYQQHVECHNTFAVDNTVYMKLKTRDYEAGSSLESASMWSIYVYDLPSVNR